MPELSATLEAPFSDAFMVTRILPPVTAPECLMTPPAQGNIQGELRKVTNPEEKLQAVHIRREKDGYGGESAAIYEW